MDQPPQAKNIRAKRTGARVGKETSTHAPNQLAKGKLTQQIAPTEETPEPSVWRTIGRLVHEFLYLIFFVGLHFLIKWAMAKTHQENEWWASYLLFVSMAYAVIAFTVIFGSELIVDCKHAIQFMIKHLRKQL